MVATGTDDIVLLVILFVAGWAAGILWSKKWNKLTSKPEVLFFPDNQLPCNSFYKQLQGRNFVCPKVNCQFAHMEKGLTSLMKVFLFLQEAQNSIDLCLFDFTLHVLADHLIAAKTRGIKIRIITDAHVDRQQKQDDTNQAGGDHRQGTGDQIPRLQAAGIPIKINKSDGQEYALMHNKFALVDSKSLIMGSFNWTKSAVLKNHEAIIKTDDPRIVGKFVEKFSEIWKKSKNRPKK